MFCQKCGCRNAENVAFCQNCGAPLSAQRPGAGAPQPRPNMAQRGPQSSHPVLNAVKTMASSTLFLVAAIAYSAALLLKLISTILGSNSILGYVSQILSMAGMSGYIGEYLYPLRGVSLFFGIVGLIPAILITLGLWLFFTSAANRQSGGIKTAGLTIIKVITIINLVCIILELVLVIICCVVIMVALPWYMSDVIPYLIGVMVGFIIGFGLMILYSAKCIGTINTMKQVIATGRPNDKVSAFVAVMNYICGGLTALAGIVSIFTGSVILGLANVCSAAALIVFGICIFSYRGKMRMLMAGNVPAQPVGQAPVQPAYQAPVQQYSAQPVCPEPAPQFEPPQAAGQENYVAGETGSLNNVFFADEGTTVLSSNPSARVLPHLVRVKDNGMIYVTSQVFRIGKDAACSDYCISDNPAISRKHAEIVCRNGEYFIVDKNSTNHVYVNGGMIPSEVEIKLSDGMEVTLGDEVFQFRMH